jgi:hypothetical protein
MQAVEQQFPNLYKVISLTRKSTGEIHHRIQPDNHNIDLSRVTKVSRWIHDDNTEQSIAKSVQTSSLNQILLQFRPVMISRESSEKQME